MDVMNGDITGGDTAEPARDPHRGAQPLERWAGSFEFSGSGLRSAPEARGITVERLLGAGESALVWLVWWDSPAEPDWRLVDGCPPAAFALKVPRARPPARPPLARATAELQALDMLRHEHLVRAYGALETSQGLGLMLEPYSAGSLAELLGSVGTLSLGEVVTVLTPIANALGALHREGVTHGDVSPENILLAADGKPALGDLADDVILGTPRSASGTSGFAAPERELEGRLPADAASCVRREARAGLAPAADVYSLAAVAWFALSGSVPAQTQRRAPLRSLRPELTESITWLLESALETDPRRRPSAEDFAVELFRCAAPTALDLAPHVHEEVVPELPSRGGSETSRHGFSSRFGAVAAAALVFGGLVLSGGLLTPTPTTTLATQEQDPGAPDTESLSGVPSRETSGESSSRDPAPGEQSPWQMLHHRNPTHAVEGLAALRTQALREASSEQVRRYTAAQSPARRAESALVAGFAERGHGYRGAPLEISISQELGLERPDAPGSEASPGEQGIAELRATVTATGLDTGAPETQDVVLVLHREHGRWLLHTVREAGADAE